MGTFPTDSQVSQRNKRVIFRPNAITHAVVNFRIEVKHSKTVEHVEDDSDLKQLVRSFRFLNDPTAPTSPQEIDLDTKEAHDQIFITIMEDVAGFVIAFFVILGIAIYFFVRRSRSAG